MTQAVLTRKPHASSRISGSPVTVAETVARQRSMDSVHASQSQIHLLQKQLDSLLAEPTAFDPLEAGRQAARQMQQAEGGAWTGADLEARFGLTAATLRKRRKEHRIVWWKDARSQFHYPRWQFNDVGTLIPGIQEVLQIFRSADEWRVMRYFLGPRDQLANRSPLDLLRGGESVRVLAHATLHGAKIPGKLHSPAPAAQFNKQVLAGLCRPVSGLFYRLQSRNALASLDERGAIFSVERENQWIWIGTLNR